MELVRFDFLGRHGGADVLDEINAAFVALAAVALLVGTGEALETQRGVAARAESGDVAHFGGALRALDHRARCGCTEIGRALGWLVGQHSGHAQILQGRGWGNRKPEAVCAHVVHTGRKYSESRQKWGPLRPLAGLGGASRLITRETRGSGDAANHCRVLKSMTSLHCR